MKKVLIAAIAFTFAGYTNAATVTTNAKTKKVVSVNENEDKRTPIKLEDLPEAVKKSLSSTAFEGWKADSAFHVETANIAYYEIVMIKGEEKTIIKLDKDGNTVA